MRTIFQWLRWVCLLLLGLAWTTTPSFAAVGALNQANGGVTIRYDATETQNRGYDAEPLRAWDNNPPEMVDASAFFGSPAQFLAAKTLPNVTEKGLARIESHLGNLGALDDGANQAMLSRLRSGQTTTPDINFYMHELKESARMRAGLDYDAAHKATLQWQGIPYGPASPAQIYHPDVIRQFSTEFNPAAWPQ